MNEIVVLFLNLFQTSRTCLSDSHMRLVSNEAVMVGFHDTNISMINHKNERKSLEIAHCFKNMQFTYTD